MLKVTIPLSRGLYQMRGLLSQVAIRSALVLTPLALVILLCVLMFSWRGKGAAQDSQLTADSEPAAQAATLTPEQQTRLAHASDNAQAAFEQLHIVHARVNVPQ